jgi:hypothetical protein
MKIKVFTLITLQALLLAGLISQSGTATAGRAEISQSNVYRFADNSAVNRASSKLVRTDSGVSMTIQTNDLPPAAFTNWWVVFNNPEFCQFPSAVDGICGGNDFPPPFGAGDPAVEVDFIFATGNVVGNNGKGGFAAHLQEGDLGGSLLGIGLLDARKAEIHLVVRSHGDKVPGLVSQQIHTINGGCPPNACVDVQFAIHP